MIKEYINKLRSLQDGKLCTRKTPKLIYQFVTRFLSERIGKICARSIPTFEEEQKENYCLRIVKNEELNQILAIYSSLFNDPVEEKHIKSLYTHFPNLFFVLVFDDKVVGYQIFKILPAIHLRSKPHFMWEIWLFSIAITRGHQGKGLGRWSLLNTMQFLKKHGPEEMKLMVDHSNQIAINLYQDLGFMNDVNSKKASESKIVMSINLREMENSKFSN
jgi:ribosomal protein S18 acetylase RimI-like enzyme